MSRHFAIDSIAMRDSRVFGWGWFLDTDQTILRSELRVPLVDGTEGVLACLPGGMRADVANAFPHVPHAPSAGFMLRGHLQAAPVAAEVAVFTAWLRDGTYHEIILRDFPGAFIPLEITADTDLGPLSQRVLQIWRQRGWLGVGDSAFRSTRKAWSAARSGFMSRRMHARLRRCVIVFDHAMGGGANRFREDVVNAHLARGRAVAVVTPQLARLQYQLDVRFPDGGVTKIVRNLAADILEILDSVNAAAIHVNDLVSFDDPLGILAWCKVQQAAGAQLNFYVHDFHSVCPSFTLIDRGGRYCGVPGLDACRRCLPDNAIHTLGFHQYIDLPDWRGPWRHFLMTCDQIVAFSDAAARILLKAYPDLQPARILVRPHGTTRPALRPVQASRGAPLVIAVVGHINVAKGSGMVAEMAHIARTRRLPVRFVVIGTLDQHLGSDEYLRVLGNYNAADLPDLLEQQEAGLCLLPSICPETYSYVTDEVMQTGMPLAVFGIGAPAERVARYEHGLVMDDIDAYAALIDIMEFAGRRYPPAARAS